MAEREFPIVVKLGGRKAAFQILKDRGLVTTEDALRMQAKRGVLPGDVARALMAEADLRSVRYDANDFCIADAAA